MSLPDFMTDPNAVFGDKDNEWRYNRILDYNKVNATYEEEKTQTHDKGSLEWLVFNLVKEKEMSYKLRADRIRTINKEKYRFSVNGKPWQNIDSMIQIGTYNAFIGDTELYKASDMDFSESHKLFKRDLRAFSWEVISVYSGPPVGDGKKFEAHATNEVIEIFGVTVARVNENFEIEELETFYDSSDMLRQMSKNKKDGFSNPEEVTAPYRKCPFNSK